MKEKHENTMLDEWATCRPEIKVLDCTVRDGGLTNAHQFTDEFVKGVYAACVAAGVDYMELGYKGAKRLYSPVADVSWPHCDLRRSSGLPAAHVRELRYSVSCWPASGATTSEVLRPAGGRNQRRAVPNPGRVSADNTGGAHAHYWRRVSTVRA